MCVLNAPEQRGVACLLGTAVLLLLVRISWQQFAGPGLVNFDSRPRTGRLPEFQLDPNTAPQRELVLLPGIGPRLAERVQAERAVRPFRQLSDLTRVKGIGPGKVAKLSKFLVFPAKPGRPP